MLTYLLSAYFSPFYRTLCISQFQLRPAPPPPPLGYCGALAHLFSPGVGHLQISRCSGAGHLTSPGLFPALDTHAVSCQHITTQRILLEKTQIGMVHLSRTGACKGMFSILCTHLLWLIKPELHNEESGAIDVNQRFLVGEPNFG